MLEKMANGGFFLSVWQSLANSYLYCIASIFLFHFHLCYLASVDLDDSAWDDFAPFIPIVSHANLVAHQTCSLAVSCSWFTRLKLKLLVDFVFKACKCLIFSFDAKLL